MSDLTKDDVRTVLNAVGYSDSYTLAHDDYHGLVRISSPVSERVIENIHENV